MTGTITFERCKPSSATDASASLPGGGLTSGGTFTWSTSGRTTTVVLSSSSPGRGLCKKPKTELDVSGPVLGGTSTYTGADDWVSMQLCEGKSGALSLAPHTSAGL